MSVPRRTFLSVLASVPVLSDWLEGLRLVPPQKPPKDEKTEDIYLAVEVLRLINTAEKWHFQETGQHVSKEELPTSRGYKKLSEWSHARKRFKHIFDDLGPANRFEFSGFEVFVEPNGDRSKYVAMVSVKRPEYSFAYVSGEEGAIFQVQPPPLPQPEVREWVENLVAERPAQREKLLAERAAQPRRTGLFATISASRIFTFLFSSFVPPQANRSGCACCDEVCGLPPASCGFPSTCLCFLNCPSGCEGIDSYCCMNIGCDLCNCTWCRASECSPACADQCGCQDNCVPSGYSDCNCLP